MPYGHGMGARGPLARMRGGDVRERTNRHAWRACDPSGSKGSNPFVSASVVGSGRGPCRTDPVSS